MEKKTESGMSLTVLEKENKRLRDEYDRMMADSAKAGDPWETFSQKAAPIKERLFVNDKHIRKMKEPAVIYGREWTGETMTLEKFKELSLGKEITDDDGYGEYATETAKSDIRIIPSDILMDIYRTDFTHVIWFTRIKE